MDDTGLRDSATDPEARDIRSEYANTTSVLQQQAEQHLKAIASLINQMQPPIEQMKTRVPDQGDEKIYSVNMVKETENRVRSIRDSLLRVYNDSCTVTVIS